MFREWFDREMPAVVPDLEASPRTKEASPLPWFGALISLGQKHGSGPLSSPLDQRPYRSIAKARHPAIRIASCGHDPGHVGGWISLSGPQALCSCRSQSPGQPELTTFQSEVKMNKSLIFFALILLFAACTPTVQEEVQPEQAVHEASAEILAGLSELNYQPGKVFEAANVVRLASGEEVVISTLELSEGHWVQLETGEWIISAEYVEADLAYEWLETYQGDSVVEQAIVVSEASDEAGKTTLYYTCTWAQTTPDACGFLYAAYMSDSPYCPCLSFCSTTGHTIDRIILVPCR